MLLAYPGQGRAPFCPDVPLEIGPKCNSFPLVGGLPSAVLLREADAADVFSAVEDRHPEKGLRSA